LGTRNLNTVNNEIDSRGLDHLSKSKLPALLRLSISTILPLSSWQSYQRSGFHIYF